LHWYKVVKNVCRKWKHASLRLELLKNEGAAFRTGSGLYDEALILERTAHLKRVREIGDLYEILFAVRADLLRNIGNIASSTLHKDLLVIPKAIEEYIQEVRSCIQEVSRASAIPIEDRLMFLRETRHAFGRTALVLSGGGSFGAFHLGVIRSLLDASLLPRVLSGSSAGAIVVAVVGTRTRAELKELFASLDDRIKDIDFYSANTASQIARHLLLKGTLQDYRVLQEKLRDLLGEYTFEEAYAQSGIAINVAVSAADTSEPPRLLNYLTAPNVLVWSAVACSSAFPFLYAPQTLLARDSKGRIIPFANKAAGESQRRWRDGSLEEDLPMRGL
jgi:TAG lipase/steryl ester hydrolase/phospholipase A2/LPA acyltransferase